MTRTIPRTKYNQKSAFLCIKSLSTSFTFALYVYLFCTIAPVMAQNPTPEEIAEDWAGLSGNQGGKIAYMTRESGETMVINLLTGEPKKVADFAAANTKYGLSGSVKWSADGKRLTMQNDKFVKVMQADGSNMKTVADVPLEGDLIVHSWSGNDKIVYSTDRKIMRATIDENNNVTATEELISDPPDGQGYCSVTMNGDYLAFVDRQANWPTGGAHRPCIVNVQTGELRRLVSDKSDGCQLRVKNDGSGVVMFMEWTHTRPATIKNWEGQVIDQIPFIVDPVDNNAIQHMRWSNDTNFIMVMGQSKEPKYAWIVRMADKAWVYIGDQSYHPDLWVGDESVVSHLSSLQHFPEQITIRKLSSGRLQIKTNAEGTHEISLYNARGVQLTTATTNGKKPCLLSLSHFARGLYFIRIKTAGKSVALKTVVFE